MDVRPAKGIGRLVRARREQRMREEDMGSVELDDACLERRPETGPAIDPRGLLGDRDRRVGVGRCGQQEVAALGREGEQPVVHEVVERLWHRERLPRLDRDTFPPKRADDLERVERVAAGRAVNLDEQRARKRDPEIALHDPVERRGIERADRELGEPPRRKRPAELRGEQALERGAAREEHADELVPQPPGRVHQRARRRGVEPLGVVHRDHEGTVGREPAERVEHRHADGVRIGHRALVVAEQESARERPSLRRRERREGVVEHRVQEVAEAGERERDLPLGGPRAQHEEPALARILDPRLPERRLAHAGLPLEDERSCAVGDPGNEAQRATRARRRGRRWRSASAQDIVRLRTSGEQCAGPEPMRDTRQIEYTIFRQPELEWVPRGDDDPRTVARLSDSMTQSRANLWRYPPGARGRRHADNVQEEVFVVLEGR